MKILFVCSGNTKEGDAIIKNQGNSLINIGDYRIEYYFIKGKGICGYLKKILPLRKYLKQNNFDVIHAHYSLSAFIASLAGARPLVVSLMGSDVKSGWFYKWIIRVFNYCFFWKVIMVKSEDMKEALGMKKVFVMPNGVDLGRFKPLDKIECQLKLGWNVNRRHLLFAANPERYEKNYALVESAVNIINDANIQIHFLKNIPNAETPFWYNAADVVILTSLWEGSPNAIKEAMACNCPIVATRVGDVEWLFGDEVGCFLTDFDINICVRQINEAILFSRENGKTNGRRRINMLGLDSKNVAGKLEDIYKSILD